MSDIIVYVLGAIIVFLGGAFAVEKGKTAKAREQRNKAETRVIEIGTEADVKEIVEEHTAARGQSGSGWFGSWLSGKDPGKPTE